MGLMHSSSQFTRSLADATGRSEPEVVSFVSLAIMGALLATAVIEVVRAIDALLELAWPVPFGKGRRT